MYLHVYNNVTVYSLHPFLVTGDDRGELVYITDVQDERSGQSSSRLHEGPSLRLPRHCAGTTLKTNCKLSSCTLATQIKSQVTVDSLFYAST